MLWNRSVTDLSQFSSKIHQDLFYYFFGIFLKQLFQFLTKNCIKIILLLF